MNITVNGENRELHSGSHVGDLLALVDPGTALFAVEVNEEVVPRSELAHYPLHEGDRVEIVRAIGGG